MSSRLHPKSSCYTLALWTHTHMSLNEKPVTTKPRGPCYFVSWEESRSHRVLWYLQYDDTSVSEWINKTFFTSFLYSLPLAYLCGGAEWRWCLTFNQAEKERSSWWSLGFSFVCVRPSTICFTRVKVNNPPLFLLFPFPHLRNHRLHSTTATDDTVWWPNDCVKFLENPSEYIAQISQELDSKRTLLRSKLETVKQLSEAFVSATLDNCIKLAKELFQDIFW